MTQAAMARPEEEAVLGRPRQAAFLTAGVVAVTALVFALVADHGALTRIQRRPTRPQRPTGVPPPRRAGSSR